MLILKSINVPEYVAHKFLQYHKLIQSETGIRPLHDYDNVVPPNPTKAINYNTTSEAIVNITTGKWRENVKQKNMSTQFKGEELANNFRNYEPERLRESESFTTKLKVCFIKITFFYHGFTNSRHLGLRI